MMLFYQTLDFIVTLSEMLSLLVPIYCFLKKPRFSKGVSFFMPVAILLTFTYMATWFSDVGIIKTPIILLMAFLCLLCFYKDSALLCLVVIEIWFVIYDILPETGTFTLANWIWDREASTMIDGSQVIRWEGYIIYLLLRLVTVALTYKLLRNFHYQMQWKDAFILWIDFLVATVPFLINTYGFLNLNTPRGVRLDIISAVLGSIFILHFLYSKNALYLWEQKQKNEMQIEQLQRQYAYYQDKLKDEERIRSIYHDMKNHLLVLENISENSEQTQGAIRDLREQISDYENYVHTGNEFLDIIIRDKSKAAKEREIDFSVQVHFEGGTFMEALDISTMFGNALDNAIEACEKLPADKRVITLKACKVREMMVITVTNNTQPGVPLPEKTSKKDELSHGFGMPNIRNVCEKYGGSCSTKLEDGVFTLKIILPME